MPFFETIGQFTLGCLYYFQKHEKGVDNFETEPQIYKGEEPAPFLSWHGASGIATGGQRGAECPLDNEKYAKNQEKEGENQEKEGKI